MRKICKFYVLLLIVGAVAGCASSDVNYAKPSMKKDSENELVVNKSFNSTWEDAVDGLSQSFFVINNISKDSGIINVSFSTDQPSQYIDCGSTTWTSSHPARGEQTWIYEVADDSSVWYGVEGTNHIGQRTRNTDLSGRINIFLKQISAKQTRIRTNIRYVLNIKVIEQGITAPHHGENTSTVTFSSGETGGSEGDAQCVATGNLENEVLSAITR